ncbi:hypothetical protein DIPPA_19501 [Diplonema papillatum]|nr:hypothetical protein DIPPA_19501 [Diplonema papillatum]
MSQDSCSLPLPQSVLAAGEEISEIEQSSRQITEDLLRKFDAVQGVPSVASDGHPVSFAGIFSQLSDRRRVLGSKISSVGDTLFQLGAEYKHNIPLANHIVSQCDKLVTTLCDQLVGFARVAQEWAVNAGASARIVVGKQFRQHSEWGAAQLYHLLARKNLAWRELSDGTRKRLQWIHHDLPSCIDLVNAKLLDYSSCADVPEMTRKLEHDMRYLADKATLTASRTAFPFFYHNHPSLGYLVDGIRREVSDTPKPLVARMFSAFLWLFWTVLIFCKTALWSFFVPLSDIPDARSGTEA